VVPGQRIPNKSHMVVAYELEKSVRIKPWKMALTWLPSPVKEPRIRSSIGFTVLVLINFSTGGTIIQRASFGRNPLAIGVIT